MIMSIVTRAECCPFTEIMTVNIGISAEKCKYSFFSRKLFTFVLMTVRLLTFLLISLVIGDLYMYSYCIQLVQSCGYVAKFFICF